MENNHQNPQLEGEFFSHGKLLFAGEYFVLDEAVAFAIPTKKGQHLSIEKNLTKDLAINWKSYDHENQLWFEAKFHLKSLDVINTTDEKISGRLSSILKYIQSNNQALFQQPLTATTRLEFDLNWGFGSSSTLLSNLAQWADLDPFEMAKNTFGGSGYDIACATSDRPIFYQNTTPPTIKPHRFDPSYKDHLFLVWLGKKQDSRQGIAIYKSKGEVDPGLIRQISQLSMMMAKAADLSTFCSCIQELERLTGDYIQRVPLQEVLFGAVPGAVKSLGAWGGDFALIATPWDFGKVKAYCGELGLDEVYRFSEIVI